MRKHKPCERIPATRNKRAEALSLNALDGELLGTSVELGGLEAGGSSGCVGVVETEADLRVLPSLAVGAVSVGVVDASRSVVAHILAVVNDGRASHRAVLRARNRRVGLIAHSGLRVIGPVETEAHVGVLPVLAVRAVLMGIISAVSQVIAV